ncbi:hypothetical protein [Phreatobacter sp.]|uniref:hypothetical protein n=1 Tax=Phreatobacter sp. TaxID=1966341 RepID=UPI0022C1B041|nr:hypothetical protein [Phreatobacter sp.]MCZ8316570.1 hypothetical protein [Phreatobacter sp.]
MGHATGVIGLLRHHLRRGRRWLRRRRALSLRVARLEAEVEHLRHGLDATSALYERRLDQLTARLVEMEAAATPGAGSQDRPGGR